MKGLLRAVFELTSFHNLQPVNELSPAFVNVLSLHFGTLYSQNKDKRSVKLGNRVRWIDWGNELMIYALNNGQGTMSQSKLFQKPLQNIEEYVDEPKVDIRKMKKLTGEIQIPVTPKQLSFRDSVAQFFYDLKFYMGLDGKHEKNKREVNRKFLALAILLIPIGFMGYQECQKLTNSTSATTGADISASVQSQLSRSQNIVNAATKGDAAALGNALEEQTATQAELPSADQEQFQPEASAPVAQYHSQSAPVTVMQPVGRHAPKTTSNIYATAEEFWRAHPDLARSVRAGKYGQSAAAQTDGLESRSPSGAGDSNTAINSGAPAAATTTATAATATRQVSNAHNQSHM